MTSKHTPGPWKIIYQAARKMLTNWKTNACLFVNALGAATERDKLKAVNAVMLDALDSALNFAAAIRTAQTLRKASVVEMANIEYRKIRAAIAKAKAGDEDENPI